MLFSKQIKDFDNFDFTFNIDFYNDFNLFIISESSDNLSQYSITEMYEKIGKFIREEYHLDTFIYIEKYINDNYLRLKNFESSGKSSIQAEHLTLDDIKKLTSHHNTH